MRTPISALFLVAVTFAASVGQSAKAPFFVDISGPKTVKAGVPIEIKIVLTNTSDHSIDFKAHTPDEFNYSTEVFEGQSQPAKYTGRGHFMVTHKCDPKDVDPNGFLSCTFGEFGPPILISLRPSGKYVTYVVVTEQFRMSEPGDYSIRVSRSTAGDPENRILVKSNMITVTVTP